MLKQLPTQVPGLSKFHPFHLTLLTCLLFVVVFVDSFHQAARVSKRGTILLSPHPKSWYPSLVREAALYCRSSRYSQTVQLDAPLYTLFLFFLLKHPMWPVLFPCFCFVFHIMCFCFSLSLFCMSLFLSQCVFPHPPPQFTSGQYSESL